MNAIATVAQMVKEAENHADAIAPDRLRASEYYNGEMKDTPSLAGRSKMATRDVRAQIKKVLPSMMRTLLGSAQVVEFLPVSQNDEQGAEQATDFVNSVLIDEADIRRTIEDGLHDALLLRNGILRWWYEEKVCVSFSSHSGLSEVALAELVSGDDVEVLEHTARQEQIEGMQGPEMVTLHDLRIKRRHTQRAYRTAAVPRERFLIHTDAVTLDESPIVGERSTMRRSDLVAMGYDKELVWSLPTENDDDAEEDERRDGLSNDSQDPHKANEQVDYYDLFVRFDMDGDGIAELRHMCFAGGLTEKNLLIDEECDEIQYCDIAIMRKPHQWEGISLADDLMDIQRTKTVLLRQTLDNLYWQNNPQRTMQRGAIEDDEPIYNPEFGKPIVTNQGFSVRDSLGFETVPFVAAQSFAMMEYLDGEAQDRTGVSDASAGLAPDALQNMTAKASAMIEQAGIGQTEMMVRTAAEGLRHFFRGILKMIIRHQDQPRTVRLRDEWVEFDPRQWNADMDCSVNTGLGAGTRERDMMVMQQVMGLQEKLLSGFGPDNPFVKPGNVYAALSKLIEAAGLKTVSTYFTEPDEAEVQAKLEAMRNQPSPEMMKAQAQQQEAQAKMQAQMQADQAQLELDRMKAEGEMQLAREQMQAEFQLKREQMAAEIQLKRERMAMDMVRAPMGDSGGVSQIRMGGAVG